MTSGTNTLCRVTDSGYAPARSGIMAAMFAMKPAGTGRSPFASATQIPTGKGANHEAEGVLEILPAGKLKRGWMTEAERKAAPEGTP